MYNSVLYNLINNMIKVGTISSVNKINLTARATFEDRSNQVSKEIPVIMSYLSDLDEDKLPIAGDQVLCLFLPNGLEEGFIIGKYKCQ